MLLLIVEAVQELCDESDIKFCATGELGIVADERGRLDGCFDGVIDNAADDGGGDGDIPLYDREKMDDVASDELEEEEGGDGDIPSYGREKTDDVASDELEEEEGGWRARARASLASFVFRAGKSWYVGSILGTWYSLSVSGESVAV